MVSWGNQKLQWGFSNGFFWVGQSTNRDTKIGYMYVSMDWFKGKNTGKPHISWENLWFPVDFPLNQSIECNQQTTWSL